MTRHRTALDAWRREVAAGTRSPKDMDWLRAAAGWETAALEAEALGQDALALRQTAWVVVSCAELDPEALPAVMYNPRVRGDWARAHRKRMRGAA